MKKRKVEIIEKEIPVYDDGIIKIFRNETNEYFFEIVNEVTNDIAEGVAIMMRLKNKWNSKIWDMNISNFNLYEIRPERALYWLSGGNDEWKKLENYKRRWCDVYQDFNIEYSQKIVDIVNSSKTLKDVRKKFIKSLSIQKMYEFALSNRIA